MLTLAENSAPRIIFGRLLVRAEVICIIDPCWEVRLAGTGLLFSTSVNHMLFPASLNGGGGERSFGNLLSGQKLGPVAALQKRYFETSTTLCQISLSIRMQ